MIMSSPPDRYSPEHHPALPRTSIRPDFIKEPVWFPAFPQIVICFPSLSLPIKLRPSSRWDVGTLISLSGQRLMHSLTNKPAKSSKSTCAHVDLEDLAGLFLSECIKRCPDNEISVPTSHLDEGLSFIGRDNDGKQITICGNAGNHTGSFMKSGRIEVLGNAGWCSGEYLSGGELIIRGNAGHELGHGMDGGILRVYGTASGNIGVDAEKGNGEIYIEGKFDKSLISIYASGCKIFHRGKLVYDHGRII